MLEHIARVYLALCWIIILIVALPFTLVGMLVEWAKGPEEL